MYKVHSYPAHLFGAFPLAQNLSYTFYLSFSDEVHALRIGFEELIIGIYFSSACKSYVVSWAQCTPCKASVLVSFLLTLLD